MAATAPTCNVTVTAPRPDPAAPKGFRILSPNATLQDVINTVNSNTKAMQQAFDDMLKNALDNGFLPSTRVQVRSSGQQGQQSRGNLGDEIDRRIGQLRFMERVIARKKIRVENPNDRQDYVVDDRVQSLVMTDQRTGASWVFSDKRAGSPR